MQVYTIHLLTGSPGHVEALGSAALVSDKLDHHLVALWRESHQWVEEVVTFMVAAQKVRQHRRQHAVAVANLVRNTNTRYLCTTW